MSEALVNVRRLLAEEEFGALQEILDELQRYDISEALRTLEPVEVQSLLSVIPPGAGVKALEHLDYDTQYALLDSLAGEVASRVLSAMSRDAVTDLVMAVHPRQSERILRLLPADELPAIRRLMEYPEQSAGGRMSVDCIAVGPCSRAALGRTLAAGLGTLTSARRGAQV